jgi:hypothetical protein
MRQLIVWESKHSIEPLEPRLGAVAGLIAVFGLDWALAAYCEDDVGDWGGDGGGVLGVEV